MMEDYDTPEYGDCFDCGAHYEGFGETPPCITCQVFAAHRIPCRIFIFDVRSEIQSICYPNFRRRQQLLFDSIHRETPIRKLLRNSMWARVGDKWTKCPDNCPDPFHPKDAGTDLDTDVDTKDSNTKNLK